MQFKIKKSNRFLLIYFFVSSFVFVNAQTTENMLYEVRLGTFQKSPSDRWFKILHSINNFKSEVLPDSSIRYSVGPFTTKEEAEKQRGIAKQKGITDAFVYKLAPDTMPLNKSAAVLSAANYLKHTLDSLSATNKEKMPVMVSEEKEKPFTEIVSPNISVFFIVVFISLSVIFSTIIFINRIYKTVSEKKRVHFLAEYQAIMESLLAITESNEQKRLEQLDNVINTIDSTYKSDVHYRNILLKKVIELYKNNTGVKAANIYYFYTKLELFKVSILKLHSKKWDIKAIAVRELSQMDYSESYDNIYKYINHPKYYLRMEIQLALVNFRAFEGLEFLDQEKFPLSDWQQLNLIGLLKAFKSPEMPDFSKWLKSENDTVVIFAIKLISHFNQQHLMREVTRSLRNPNLEVKLAAVYAIGKLQAGSAISVLKKNYYIYEKGFKLGVLDVVREIATSKDLPFLEVQLLNDDYDISMAAGRAILALGADGEKLIETIHNTYADNKLKKITDHLTDKLI